MKRPNIGEIVSGVVSLKSFDISGSNMSTNGTIHANSNTLEIDSAIDFQNFQGIVISDDNGNSFTSRILGGAGTKVLTLMDHAPMDFIAAIVGHDDSKAMLDAVDFINKHQISELEIPDGIYPVHNDVLFPSNILLKIHPNAVLNVSTNAVLTVNGQIEFNGTGNFSSGDGTVTGTYTMIGQSNGGGGGGGDQGGNSISTLQKDLSIFDVTSYGAAGSNATFLGAIISGSTQLNFTAATDFKNGQGIAINGVGPSCTLAVPTNCSATLSQQNIYANNITSTTYEYAVVAIDSNGGYTPASASSLPITFSKQLCRDEWPGSNCITVTWTPVAGAVNYAIYRQTNGTWQLCSFSNVVDSNTGLGTWVDYGFSPWNSYELPNNGVGLPNSYGAGRLITSIISGENTTTLTLAHPASTSNTSGCRVYHDDTAAIQSAVSACNSAGGGDVLIPLGSYPTTSKVTVYQNVHIKGVAASKWVAGSQILFRGFNTSAFSFDPISSHGEAECAIIENVQIISGGMVIDHHNDYTGQFVAGGASLNFKAFTGIDINIGQWNEINNVFITGADTGIKMSGSSGPLYLTRVIDPIITCCNTGIWVAPGGNWMNGLWIKIRDISSNEYGIIADGNSTGSTIEGEGAEIGNNYVAIQLVNGTWSIRGSLWAENCHHGIEVQGGNHVIDGNLGVNSPIVVTGGSIINNNKGQASVLPAYQGISANDILCWYSFNEQSGNTFYDRSPNKYHFTSSQLTRVNSGYFNSSVTTSSSTPITLPVQYNWNNPWTALVLFRGDSTQSQNKVFELTSSASPNEALTFSVQSAGLGLRYYSPANVYSFLANMNALPHDTMFNDFDWVILQYDGNNFTSYNPSGFQVGSPYSFAMPTATATFDTISILSPHVTLDEFILCPKLLSQTQIIALTTEYAQPVLQQVASIPSVVAEANDATVTLTNQILASFTPNIQQGVWVDCYWRLDSDTNLTLYIHYTDGSGNPQTIYIADGSMQTAGTQFYQGFINATPATPVQVIATAGTSGVAHITCELRAR